MARANALPGSREFATGGRTPVANLSHRRLPNHKWTGSTALSRLMLTLDLTVLIDFRHLGPYKCLTGFSIPRLLLEQVFQRGDASTTEPINGLSVAKWLRPLFSTEPTGAAKVYKRLNGVKIKNIGETTVVRDTCPENADESEADAKGPAERDPIAGDPDGTLYGERGGGRGGGRPTGLVPGT